VIWAGAQFLTGAAEADVAALSAIVPLATSELSPTLAATSTRFIDITIFFLSCLFFFVSDRRMNLRERSTLNRANSDRRPNPRSRTEVDEVRDGTCSTSGGRHGTGGS
jgi:hypothetical protein